MTDEETEFKLTPEQLEFLKICTYFDRRDYEKRRLLKSLMTYSYASDYSTNYQRGTND